MSLQDATEQGQKKADARAPESKDWQRAFDILPIFGMSASLNQRRDGFEHPDASSWHQSYGSV